MATQAAASARRALRSAALDDELEQRLLRYTRIDTQSDEASTTCPSTERQYDLLRLLEDELKAMSAQGVRLTD